MIESLIAALIFAFFMATILFVRLRREVNKHKSTLMTCHERSQCCSGSSCQLDKK